MNNKKNIITGIIVFLLGAALMYGMIYFFPQQFSEVITKTEKDVTVTDEGISDAVDKIYDAVVVVGTYSNDNQISSGTGFVYEVKDGKAYILTNEHVINGGNKITVTLTNGEVYETEIIGSNELDDIAVLAIDEEYILKVASLGSSEDLEIGDTSFAVGAPLDSAFSWTVTRGIISGKDRLVEVEADNQTSPSYIMNVMQTDAAINSGNSGGPLCNSNGEVIGITTLKLASEGVEGMGFAIPIEEAIKTAEEIMNGETTSQPYLGVAMLDYASAYASASYNNFKNIFIDNDLNSGIIITEVVESSAADNAGLKVNDIITHIDGVNVSTIAYFKYELYKNNVGDKVDFTIVRDGKTQTITVTLGSSQPMS